MTGARPRFRTSPGPARWWRGGSGGEVEAALALDEAVTALGRHPHPCHDARQEPATVALDRIVGTVARPGEFDRAFTPRHSWLRPRWEQVAALAEAGTTFPAVRLVRVGELYFVDDGHHRISVARARGQLAIDAVVRPVCSIAYACACLTRADLATKAAERDFLRQVPLPDPALRLVWLDDLAQYRTLAAAGQAWSGCRGGISPDPGCVLDVAVAAAWWDLEVLPRARAVADSWRRFPSTAAAYLHAAS